jgi:hypothetical protein
MRIRRNHRGPVEGRNHQMFLIYDETTKAERTQLDELREKFPVAPAGCDPETFHQDLAKRVRELDKVLYGPALDHPHLAYVQINRDGSMHFEFDSERPYTPDELKTMMRKANAAKKRLTWGEPKS